MAISTNSLRASSGLRQRHHEQDLALVSGEEGLKALAIVMGIPELPQALPVKLYELDRSPRPRRAPNLGPGFDALAWR
jgi:hypothetical protein